ncbi:MAG: fluoride efflux transporter CrcB [Zoogloeaceae bacterium]|jgi:CrcB protein|nr:fluoride efflux transporter CrcB [Zoogloeaceae bacterium]
MPRGFSLAAFLGVGIGAALGAWTRWLLGATLNPLLPAIPLGTLAANLLGGYLVGMALGFFHLHAEVAPAVRLFVITGVLGGLTTFSSFSAETVERLHAGQYAIAFALAALHLLGSLLMTWLGLISVR